MATPDTALTARAICVVPHTQVAKIICHRVRNGGEQFLVRWKRASGVPSASALVAWHSLAELSQCMDLVQQYVLAQPSRLIAATPSAPSVLPHKRKRSSPGADVSRDARSGLLTPRSFPSAPSSVVSFSTTDPSDSPDVYNGVLSRKEGRITVAKKTREPYISVNALRLPTSEMLEEAAGTPFTQAPHAIQLAFKLKIQKLPYLYFENTVDSSAPPLSFKFVSDYVIGEGVYRAASESYEGCQAPCKPNMGQNIGCESTRCACLEYAAVDEDSLRRKSEALYHKYKDDQRWGRPLDTAGLPKHFPYMKSRGTAPPVLQAFYRHSRNAIYECNINCNCGDVCKSRLVQKGRTVPLTIFKTHGRGWGVFCNEDLVEGEFIDTYLGEVITNQEADRREGVDGKDKNSYMYSLDKHIGEQDLTEDTCYVVDGEFMGGPTRYINHSCQPNCRQYTVSYNRHDLRIYDLAFFAYEDIPAGTELTFDYMDKDEVEEEDDIIRQREEAANDPSTSKVKCRCGARRCRGYLWV